MRTHREEEEAEDEEEERESWGNRLHVWESRKRRGKRAEQLHAQIGDLLIGWEETLGQSANSSQLAAAGSFFLRPARISSCSRQTPFHANCFCSFCSLKVKTINPPLPSTPSTDESRGESKDEKKKKLFFPNLAAVSFKGRSQRFQISRTSFPCLQPCVCMCVCARVCAC